MPQRLVIASGSPPHKELILPPQLLTLKYHVSEICDSMIKYWKETVIVFATNPLHTEPRELYSGSGEDYNEAGYYGIRQWLSRILHISVRSFCLWLASLKSFGGNALHREQEDSCLNARAASNLVQNILSKRVSDLGFSLLSKAIAICFKLCS